MKKSALILLALVVLCLFSPGVLGQEAIEMTTASDDMVALSAVGVEGEGEMILSDEALAAIEASFAAYEELKKTYAFSDAVSFVPGWPAENSYYLNGLDYYPTSGNVHSPIYAIDIGPGSQTCCNILAVADGTVIYVSDIDSALSYGNYVIIDHDNGYVSLYAHLAPDSIRVGVGDTVSQGEKIAVMGTTGNSTGVHLHFEIRASDDPYTFDFYWKNPLLLSKFCFYKGLETKSVRYGAWIRTYYTKDLGKYYGYSGNAVISPELDLTPASEKNGIIKYQVDDATVTGLIAALPNSDPEPLLLRVTEVEDAYRYEITISAQTLERIIAAKSVLSGLQFDTGFTLLTLDRGYLCGLKAAAKGENITFYFRHADKYYIYGIKTASGEINAEGWGKAVATIPYCLPEGTDPNATYVRGIGSDGASFMVQDSICDAENKVVRFNYKDVVKYFVDYHEVVYPDVENFWGECYISYLSCRGIIQGMEDGTFSPSTKLTRAQMVTLLSRVAAADCTLYEECPFTDVPQDAWYAPYVNWAYGTGISQGRTAEIFDPDALVSRQEMAVLLYRFADVIGYTLPVLVETLDFGDDDQISAYAKEAVLSVQKAGIISGRTGNVFDPKGAATRCEAAKMIAMFIQGMV